MSDDDEIKDDEDPKVEDLNGLDEEEDLLGLDVDPELLDGDTEI